jgi:hypothetical protein
MLFVSELNGRSKTRVKVYRGASRHEQRRGAVGRLAYLTWVGKVEEEESVK